MSETRYIVDDKGKDQSSSKLEITLDLDLKDQESRPNSAVAVFQSEQSRADLFFPRVDSNEINFGSSWYHVTLLMYVGSGLLVIGMFLRLRGASSFLSVGSVTRIINSNITKRPIIKRNFKTYNRIAVLTGGATNDQRQFFASMASRVPDLGIGQLLFSEIPAVEFKITAAKPENWSGDTLIVPLFQPDDKEALVQLPPELSSVDNALNGVLSFLIEAESFKGAAKSSVSSVVAGASCIKRVVFFGLGKKVDSKTVDFADLGASITKFLRTAKCETACVVLPSDTTKPSASKLSEGLMNGLYIVSGYKSGDNVEQPLKLKSVELIGGQNIDEGDIGKGISIATGVYLAKDMVNAPPNYLTPQSMAETAQKVAAEYGLKCKILEEEEIRKLGMGAFLGVSQGSILPPKFIHLTYTSSAGVSKKIAVIGKGLTFDSGGYNLKAGAGSMIEQMKFDMGGAAATIGTAKVIGLLKPENVEVHFIVAACENMISDRAIHPGDIITASNNKTIEVLNTDAEGRLTLADALVYAENLGVDFIVDSATLTGAAMVALGLKYSCLYSNNDDLIKALLESSKESGDKAWHMPLPAEYKELIKSKIADLQNIGGRFGGSITAALFLQEFVKDTPWAHIDIAGPVWDDKEGATGYGVRLLSTWILKHSDAI